MKAPQWLFFDLDRTLWDFEKNSLQTLRELFEEANIKEQVGVDFEGFNAVYQEVNRACWDDYQKGAMTKAVLRTTRFRDSLRQLGVRQANVAEWMGEEYVARGPRQKHLMDGALEVLEALKSRGHRVHILTNGFKEVQHIKVENTGLGKHIEAVWTSDELGALKPALECYRGALKGAGAEARSSWMIGDDHEADVMGGHRAGLRTIHFSPSGDTPMGSPSMSSVKRLSELLAVLP